VTDENVQEQELKENPIVSIEMENGSLIKIELYPSIAPASVKNFVTLVSQGFYDGQIFHRVIPGFMIQGGDPNGTGMGGSKQTIPGEFSGNGFKNDLKHDAGVVSMARTSAPNSASSQFFIVVKASSHLDGQYAGFGKVIEGMEEVNRIVSVPKDRGDKPLEAQKMKKVIIQS